MTKRYRLWKYLHSAIAIAITLLLLRSNEQGRIIYYTLILQTSMLFLFLPGFKKGQRPLPLSCRLANLLSAIRGPGSALLLFVPPSLISPFLVLYALTDLLDGHLARKGGGSKMGAVIDEESDALFTFVLSAILYSAFDFGSWILLFGSLRYCFVLLFALTGKADEIETACIPFRRYSRLTCAVSVTILVSASFVIIPFEIRRLFLIAGLTMLIFSFLWELAIHLLRGRFALFFGLAHSFIIYYGIPGKKKRIKRLYSEFISKGSLAFDIGSHIGNRIVPWLELGAKIVAVEPNPVCISILLFLYGKKEGVEIIPAAVGSSSGTAVLYTDPAHPTLSTISEDWIRRVKMTSPFRSIRWSHEDKTGIFTLDQLIDRFGVPDFCKIDVEGSELEVLRGLSFPIPALSVEYIPSSPEIAISAVEKISELGEYSFNISRRETMRFLHQQWIEKSIVLLFLRSLEENDFAGDVYARLKK
jgi:FkbM family methyltransferase